MKTKKSNKLKGLISLKALSITFIIFGALTGLFHLLFIALIAFGMSFSGFFSLYVSGAISAFELGCSVVLLILGVLGVKKKSLNLCFNLGVLMVCISILKFMMSFSELFIIGNFGPIFITTTAISIIVPILFVRAVMKTQKTLGTEETAESSKSLPECDE